MGYLKTAFFVLFTFALASCSMSKDSQLAEDQVPAFHSSLNAGDFSGIYAASSDELKQAITEVDFTALLEAVNRKLGPLVSTSRETWNVNYHTSGTFVTLVYKSKYQQGEAAEQFVYRLKDGKAKLSGYHINSNAFITK